jgi:hypothetical protein
VAPIGWECPRLNVECGNGHAHTILCRTGLFDYDDDVFVSATLASLFAAAVFLGVYGEIVPLGRLIFCSSLSYPPPLSVSVLLAPHDPLGNLHERPLRMLDWLGVHLTDLRSQQGDDHVVQRL